MSKYTPYQETTAFLRWVDANPKIRDIVLKVVNTSASSESVGIIIIDAGKEAVRSTAESLGNGLVADFMKYGFDRIDPKIVGQHYIVAKATGESDDQAND